MLSDEPSRWSPRTLERYVLLQQFENPANPEIHFKKPPPRKSGKIPMATRSTFSSPESVPGAPLAAHRDTSSRRKEERPLPVHRCRTHRQPGHHPDHEWGASETPGPTRFEKGLCKVALSPKNLDLSMNDRVEQVSNEESIENGPPPCQRGRHPRRDLLWSGCRRRHPYCKRRTVFFASTSSWCCPIQVSGT